MIKDGLWGNLKQYSGKNRLNYASYNLRVRTRIIEIWIYFLK